MKTRLKIKLIIFLSTITIVNVTAQNLKLPVYTAVTNHLVTELASIPQGTSFLLPFNSLPSNLRCENFYYIPFYNFSCFSFFQWTPFGDPSYLSVNFYPSGFT